MYQVTQGKLWTSQGACFLISTLGRSTLPASPTAGEVSGGYG